MVESIIIKRKKSKNSSNSNSLIDASFKSYKYFTNGFKSKLVMDLELYNWAVKLWLALLHVNKTFLLYNNSLVKNQLSFQY